MHLRPFVGAILFFSALPLSHLHAQTDSPSSNAPVTRAIAVYEYTGDIAHPTAARLLPVSLFIHGHLEDAGVYLPRPIPFALQPGTLYLLQQAGQTVGAVSIQSAQPDPAPSAPAWAAYGRVLTPAEASAATTPTHPRSSIAAVEAPASPSPEQSSAKNDAASPSSARKKKQPKPQAYVTLPTTPILDDPDRPILAAAQPNTLASVPELTSLPTGLHQIAAVSDAANRPPETFAYAWPSPSLRDQTLQALEALALPPLAHYIAFNHLIPAPTPTPASGPSFANAPTLSLSNPQLLAYTLPNAAPTCILTAELPLSTGGPIYLTLIAQPGPDHQLHLALASITDATHLDRAPWLRPIDAADPDPFGSASLLFELRSQTTRQFALYSLATSAIQQILLTSPISSSPPGN